jgi:hypothetical protein
MALMVKILVLSYAELVNSWIGYGNSRALVPPERGISSEWRKSIRLEAVFFDRPGGPQLEKKPDQTVKTNLKIIQVRESFGVGWTRTTS